MLGIVPSVALGSILKGSHLHQKSITSTEEVSVLVSFQFLPEKFTGLFASTAHLQVLIMKLISEGF